MPETNAPLLIIIDGHSLAFRAYYAFGKAKKGPLRTSTGIPTSVCFGFLNSLFQVLETQQPQLVAIAFDRQEATFRHRADPNYKADREETPAEFIKDLENLQKLLEPLNLKIVTAAGYEADDLIATLTRKASETGMRVKIVTGDRDLFQLVNDERQISVLYLDRNLGNYREFDAEAVGEKLGIKPEQVVDYKALCGDKSDNIPGITGIGEKTAVKLLRQYQTLENIYSNLKDIKGAINQKLSNGKDKAQHSQYLAKLVANIPLEVDIEDCQLVGFNREEIIPKLEQLELKKFIAKIDLLQQHLGGKLDKSARQQRKEGTSSQQLSLFSLNSNPTVIKPKIIDTPELLEELEQILSQQTNYDRPVAWDTETTSLQPRKAQLVGVGCCWGKAPTEVAYIPLNHSQGRQLDFNKVINVLKSILENSAYPKVFQHTKFDRLVLLAQGINLSGVVFDPMLASYVLSPEESHKLSNLSRQYLSKITAFDYESLEISKGKTMADLDINLVAEYCGLDAYATFNLVPFLQAKLNQVPELKRVFELEMQLEPILAQMETEGVRIDEQYLQQLAQEIEQYLIKIERQAYEDAGEEFNLNSPKQLSELLFNKLGLDKRKSRKIKTGYSTNHTILERLQGDHPVIEQVLAHRTLAKLKSTYIDALPALIDPQTKRIHTDYNQSVTATGRLSSSNPNLQNIPIRTEFSRQIRKAFIPETGWLFLSADYSQIELRILAHLSQEPILLEAYRTSQDIHRVTAQLLFDKKNITPEERSLGKTINFGVIYGMGAQKFARETKVAVREAQKFIDKYRQKYAGVFAYLEKIKKQAIAQGYVETILGRRRYFEFSDRNLQRLRGSNPHSIDLNQLRLNNYDAQLLRAAANAPIQGSSADIIKMAMVKLAEILENYQAKLLLQVHDELVFEVPPEELADLQIQIKRTMENVLEISVPLVVDIHVGTNWMEAK
jgi:DNA polymerase-1